MRVTRRSCVRSRQRTGFGRGLGRCKRALGVFSIGGPLNPTQKGVPGVPAAFGLPLRPTKQGSPFWISFLFWLTKKGLSENRTPKCTPLSKRWKSTFISQRSSESEGRFGHTEVLPWRQKALVKGICDFVQIPEFESRNSSWPSGKPPKPIDCWYQELIMVEAVLQ